MTPYDAEYKDDAMVKRTPFNTSVAALIIPHQRDRPASSSGQKLRVDEATRAERIEQQQDRQLQAAKSILRSRREGLSADSAVFSASDVQLNESKQRLFGKLQRGQSERFMHPHLPDAKDAVRFHHR